MRPEPFGGIFLQNRQKAVPARLGDIRSAKGYANADLPLAIIIARKEKNMRGPEKNHKKFAQGLQKPQKHGNIRKATDYRKDELL